MNYDLNKLAEAARKQPVGGKKPSPLASLQTLWPLVEPERKSMLLALVAIIINAIINLLAPVLIG